MSRFAFRLPLSVITERGPGGEVNAWSVISFTIRFCTDRNLHSLAEFCSFSNVILEETHNR